MNISVNDININYRDEGNGDAVVLLHGWGSNIELFGGIFELLTPKYRVIASDMPGFGKSDEPPKAWNVDDYADFIIEFLKTFDIDRVIFLGHSFGGRVIIKMAAVKKLPFIIDKIVLVDSAGIRPKRGLKYHAKVRIYKIGKAVLGCKPVKTFFPKALERYKRKKGSADFNAASDIMKGCLVKTVNEDLTGLLKDIKQETLIIWGENDADTPLSDGKLMEKLIPNSGLVTIKGAGHYSFLDDRYVFDRVLASYLNIK